MHGSPKPCTLEMLDDRIDSQSKEIAGMLKQFVHEMIDTQKLDKSDDSKRKRDFKQLVKAKRAGIKVLTNLIDGQLKSIGELRVKKG